MKVRHTDRIDRRPLDARTVLLATSGTLDRRRAFDVQRAIGEAVRGGHVRAVLDLRACTDVEPGVVAALLHVRRRLLAMGGELTIVGGPCGDVRALPSADSVEAARRPPAFAANRRAIVEVVGPLRRALTRWTIDAGADQRTQEAGALAGSEAITNVVVHAYREATEPGDVSVSAEVVEPECLRVCVSDRGGGMKPRPDSPGLGIGLPLMAQLTSALEIGSRPGGGTRIAMSFPLVSGR